MKKLVLAVIAVALTACSSVPNYRSLANQVVPTNVELVATVYDDTEETAQKTVTYCSGVAVSKTRIITAGHCTKAALNATVGSMGRVTALFDDKIKIRLKDGREVLAKIIYEGFREEGETNSRDIAVLEADVAILTPATIGDSDSVAVGDQVAIVGNTFGEFTYSFTVGVVSYVNRTLEVGTFIQTDALAGPGNSGGPVFNMDGELIGILTRGGGGVSLFIPLNLALKDLHEDLKKPQ